MLLCVVYCDVVIDIHDQNQKSENSRTCRRHYMCRPVYAYGSETFSLHDKSASNVSRSSFMSLMTFSIFPTVIKVISLSVTARFVAVSARLLAEVLSMFLDQTSTVYFI
jgi:hypothetical protein